MDIRVDGLTYGDGAGKLKGRTHHELAKACRDFEAVFLTILWRNMAKSAGVGLGEWDMLLAQSMGKTWANSGGIGLAKVLYNQMSNSSPRDLSGDDCEDEGFSENLEGRR